MPPVKDIQTEFMKAYETCHDRFVRYCAALSYGKMDTEDLVQDVLLSAWLHFDRIREKGELLHYLIRAARNRSVSIWRRRKYRAELAEGQQESLLAKGASPETLLDIQLLYRSMDRLPEQQRSALMLFEISGFSIREVSQILDMTEGAVKTTLSRGRKRLGKLLDDRGGGNSVWTLLQEAKLFFL